MPCPPQEATLARAASSAQGGCRCTAASQECEHVSRWAFRQFEDDEDALGAAACMTSRYLLGVIH